MGQQLLKMPQDQLRPNDDKYQADHVKKHERDGPHETAWKGHWQCKPTRERRASCKETDTYRPAYARHFSRLKLEKNQLLHYAFHFLPGQILQFEVTSDEKTWNESWEVKTDYYNNSYLESLETKSKAYFQNDDRFHHPNGHHVLYLILIPQQRRIVCCF